MKRLLFFTQSFPYSYKEPFIENEISYLSKAFDEITILPWIGEGEITRKVPANCKVLKPMLRNDRDTILSGIFCRAPFFYFIRRFFSDKAYTGLSKIIKYISVSTFCRAILSNKDFKKVNDEFKNDTVYFYWGIGTAYVLPFIKNKRKKIVRFHGADLYLERRANRYIPFRKEVYTHLTQAVYISKQGLEYASERYGSYRFNACCSYLGTLDHGVKKNFPPDGIIRLLSCSNVIPVKRVALILETLQTIRDQKIEWTHIGDGNLWEELKEKSLLLPDNIKVNFTGRRSNKQVIEYYQSQPIDIFINVSSSEGLPVAIMEAISFDIPIIATNVGGTSEIVTPETGILIAPDSSPELIAARIRELYKVKETLHPRKLWLEKFSAEKNYPDFIQHVLLPTPDK